MFGPYEYGANIIDDNSREFIVNATNIEGMYIQKLPALSVSVTRITTI